MLDRVLIAIARNARFIPESLLRGLFACAADICWLFGVGGVRQLERNLRHVLGAAGTDNAGISNAGTGTSQSGDVHQAGGTTVSRRRLRQVSRRGMRAYFAYFSEAMTVGARSEQQLRARVRGDGPGLQGLIAYVHDSTGSAPLALGHQGNWDYAGFWAHHALAPVTAVAERLGNQKLLDTFVHIRESLGMRIVLTGQKGITAQLREQLTKPNVVVALLADRDLSRHGEFVTAFGSTIRVARGPATLALDTGLPLYAVNVFRERLHGDQRRKAKSRYGYVCWFEKPIDIDRYRSLPREEAIRAISQAWVDVWAAQITRHPEDWHMLQPIFLEDLDLSRLSDVPDDILAKIAGNAA
ncbi:MAG: phosphatidylinositol mannoside acyltransferase [Bifidobacterium tibiigranuli]|jgi:KDO2-lipid IV(A) lauroyltransferase|nr:phosphatidylinositol mannoside acyltransferase [Bifidobacterium tibiigranuli]